MIGRYLNQFLEAKSAESGSALLTISAYETDIVQFLNFSGISTFSELTEERIEKFIQNLQTQQYSPKSIARKLSAIKEFCKFLYSEKIITDNP